MCLRAIDLQALIAFACALNAGILMIIWIGVLASADCLYV